MDWGRSYGARKQHILNFGARCDIHTEPFYRAARCGVTSETLRDLILERSQVFQIVDVTGAPWLEIDFPADLERANREVLPRLLSLSGVAA